MDDGSTDASGKICDEYARKDNRIKVFHKKNGGVSSARNKGIDEARGKYVVFVDSDDYLLQDRLLSILRLSSNDPDIMVGYNFTPTDNKYICKIIDKQDFDIIRNVCVIWTSAFKNKILQENRIRFDEKIWHGEDSLFVLDFFYNCRTIIFTDEYGYVYEEGHEEGLNLKFQNWDKELYVYKRIIKVSQEILNNLLNDNNEILCLNFRQMLRIIKAIYKNGKTLRYSERIKILKKLRAERYEKDKLMYKRFNSNMLIYILFNYKQYLLLDIFMCYFWILRN